VRGGHAGARRLCRLSRRPSLQRRRRTEATTADEGDDRVRGYYPSLDLNLGTSYEDVGARADAHRS